MFTPIEHILLALFAMMPFPAPKSRLQQVMACLPWLLLPDAMEVYFPNRQMSHFERAGEDVSWMVYPEEWALDEMDASNAPCFVETHLAGPDPAPVLPGCISIDLFDRMNYAHPWFRMIRAHLLQDEICRKGLGILNGQEDSPDLVEQLDLVHRLATLHLSKKLYQRTMTTYTRDLQDQIASVLRYCWPKDMAEQFIPRIIPDPVIQDRLNRMDFTIREEEKASCLLVRDLEKTLDEIFSKSLLEASIDMLPAFELHECKGEYENLEDLSSDVDELPEDSTDF